MTDQKLCDRFTKQNGKRGKPARDAICAVCETVWSQHFAEAAPERGAMRPVLHPDRVREIPEPKRPRRPKAVKPVVAASVVVASEPSIEPSISEADDEPDLMVCGHSIEALQDDDRCKVCVERQAASDRLWAKMHEWWLTQEMERTGCTREEAEAEHERLSDW